MFLFFRPKEPSPDNNNQKNKRMIEIDPAVNA